MHRPPLNSGLPPRSAIDCGTPPGDRFETQRTWIRSLVLAVCLTGTLRVAAVDESGGAGFLPLFNGRDLSGWTNVNCAPETWQVRDGVIACTGRPTGALRSLKQYENFIFELEWRHLSEGGNSGIFIWSSPVAAPGVPFLRAIEVQVLDHGYVVPGRNEWYTTHGDVFPIHGTTMIPFGRHNGQRSFPSEERSHGSPVWNHYRITGTNGVLRLEVNGQFVSGGQECNYRKGYIGLESEGAPVEFRNLRLRELPSSGAGPEVTAPTDTGWKSLFTGVDLRGWRVDATTPPKWQVQGERLRADAAPGAAEGAITTEAEFGAVEFLIDYRPAQSDRGMASLRFRGAAIPLPGATPGGYHRFRVTVQSTSVVVYRGETEVLRAPLPADAPRQSPLSLQVSAGIGGEFMNLYYRDL